MARVLFAVPMDAERRGVVEALAAGAFEPVILEDLPEGRRAAAWGGADVLVCFGFRSEFPPDLRTAAPKLRMIQTVLAGVDHMPFDRMPKAVVLCSNAGAYSGSVAEHAMALLLAAARDVPMRTEEIRQGRFDQHGASKGLRGSTLLVVGLGGIGREVARLARAFGMRVLAVTRTGRPDEAVDEVGSLSNLHRLASRADFIVLAIPLTQATHGLIGQDALRAMKDDAVLVNIARGKLIVEDDLYAHLRTHPRFRAALDVWWTYPDGKEGRPFHRPFHELPNVIMTPHAAPSVPGQRRIAMETAVRNVLRFLRGGRPENVVDPTEYPP